MAAVSIVPHPLDSFKPRSSGIERDKASQSPECVRCGLVYFIQWIISLVAQQTHAGEPSSYLNAQEDGPTAPGGVAKVLQHHL